MTNPINRIFYDGYPGSGWSGNQHCLQHIKAWKESRILFFLLFRTHVPVLFPGYRPRLKTYIDGKPRYCGVNSFLRSRNISLPYGKPDDLPGFDTICALGNLKNRFYLDLLNKEGAEVYKDALKMIKLWRSERLKTAIVSASKNCRQVLSSVGITDLFDLVFDGNDAEKNNLPGKPAPDIFLKACMLLNISNTRAVLFEDSESGIKAGKKGNFPLVVGVNRNGSGSLLYESGADLVLSKLTDLIVQPVPKKSSLLPSALSQLKEILSCVLHYKSIIFLDYDGTLTPIVSRPELAIMGESIRKALVELSDKIPVAIISGRELNDVRNLVQIPHIYYAGNHGFELRHPDGTETVLEDVKKYPPLLDRIETSLQPLRTSYPGVIIERKRFSLAVHYRCEERVDPPLEHPIRTVTQFTVYNLTSVQEGL